jgi:DNA-binding ferritin-like protein
MDRRVINLNAFGEEIIPKEKEREPFVSNDPDDSYFRSEERPFRKTIEETPKYKYETVFTNVLKNIVQSKLLHWQTAKYAQHKALDELFESLIELGDELAESIMGKYGRPVLAGELGNFTVVDYKNPESPDGLSVFMDNLYSCYSGRCKSCFSPEKDPEILNIIDEIIAIVDKTKYLLSLK